MSYNRKVNFEDAGARLDRFWSGELADSGVSRSRVKSWIEQGRALVDGRVVTKPKYRLSGGETLELSPIKEHSELEPEEKPLHVLYEDDEMVVLHKPHGLTTHPAPSQMQNTLVHRLLHHYPDIASQRSGMDPMRPGIVHRLDKDTSGVMAVARTEAARLQLAEDFAERRVDKRYLAVVFGVPEPQGVVDAPIGRHHSMKTKMAVTQKGGREALSRWRVLWTSPDSLASLVEVKIDTGRTHQIRVHMAHAGHPLLGDAVYGSQSNKELAREHPRLAALARRQMLHAYRLELRHPEDKRRLSFVSPPPQDFQKLLRQLHRVCLRVGLTGMPGCGKSTLLGLLRKREVPVFSADRAVADAYSAKGDAAEMLLRRYGGAFSLDDGSVDKAALFRAMVEQPDLRREVMHMVHPMVEHAVREFWRRHADAPLAVAEVPLLFEGDWPARGLCDVSVFVDCPDEKRTGELRKARGLDAETLATFDSWQWPSKRKRLAADSIVPNTGDLAKLEKASRDLLGELYGRLSRREEAFGRLLQSFWDETNADHNGQATSGAQDRGEEETADQPASSAPDAGGRS